MILKIKSSFKFIIVFLLVIGSVITSCATQTLSHSTGSSQRVSIRIMKEDENKYFTSEVFSKIDRVFVINMDDLSEKYELTGEWDYNNSTSEIVFYEEIPYVNPLIEVEGILESPVKFVLNQCNEQIEPFIAMNGRKGVVNLDYFWDKESKTITMNDNFSKNIDKFYIFYLDDMNNKWSYGNWHYYDDEENADLIAYEFNQHMITQVSKVSKTHKTYFVLDDNYEYGTTPDVMEKQYYIDDPIEINDSSITLSRFNKSDKELSKEVGYNVHVPAKVKFDSIIFKDYKPFIVQHINNNEIYYSTTRTYIQDDSLDSYTITIVEKERKLDNNPDDVFILEVNTIDLGMAVNRIKYWGLGYSTTEEPIAVKNIIYSWNDDNVCFEMIVLEEQYKIAEEIINQIIEYRLK